MIEGHVRWKDALTIISQSNTVALRALVADVLAAVTVLVTLTAPVESEPVPVVFALT